MKAPLGNVSLGLGAARSSFELALYKALDDRRHVRVEPRLEHRPERLQHLLVSGLAAFAGRPGAVARRRAETRTLARPRRSVLAGSHCPARRPRRPDRVRHRPRKAWARAGAKVGPRSLRLRPRSARGSRPPRRSGRSTPGSAPSIGRRWAFGWSWPRAGGRVTRLGSERRLFRSRLPPRARIPGSGGRLGPPPWLIMFGESRSRRSGTTCQYPRWNSAAAKSA